MRSTTRADKRILEDSLLGRLELLVDEQHLCARLAVGRLQLLELALPDVAAPIRLRAVLDELPHRVDAGRPRQLTELGELLLVVRTLREHGEQEPALGLGPDQAFGFDLRHVPKYAPLPLPIPSPS